MGRLMPSLRLTPELLTKSLLPRLSTHHENRVSLILPFPNPTLFNQQPSPFPNILHCPRFPNPKVKGGKYHYTLATGIFIKV